METINNKSSNWIENLKVKNFKSFNNLNVNFKNNKLNLIYGDNGVGKSTFIDLFKFILKVWSEFFYKSKIYKEIKLSNNFSNIDDLFDDFFGTKDFFKIANDNLKKEPIEIEIIFNLDNKKIKYELIYSNDEEENFVSYEKLSILNKDLTEKKVYFEKKFNSFLKINFLKEFLKDKKFILDKKNKYSLISIIDSETKNMNFIKKTFSQEFKVIKFYKDIIKIFSPFHIEDDSFESNSSIKEVIRISKKDPSYNKNLNDLMKKVKIFEEFVLALDEKIISITLEKKEQKNNRYLSNRFDFYDLIAIKKIGNKNIKIPFVKESSGTKRYLKYFSLIEIIENNNKIIFFDEFGLHLHESLTINILEYIKNLIKDKNVQLFLTTHNTLLLNDKYIKIPNKSKLILSKSKFTDVSLYSLENRNTRENNQDKFLRGNYGGKKINNAIYFDPSEE